MFQQYLTQQIRTYVPVGVGALITWLLSLGIDVGAQAQVGLITFGTALVTAGYFSAASAAQRKWPFVGRYLLGSSKAPVYVTNAGGGAGNVAENDNPSGAAQ
jgi:hypothetical protein